MATAVIIDTEGLLYRESKKLGVKKGRMINYLLRIRDKSESFDLNKGWEKTAHILRNAKFNNLVDKLRPVVDIKNPKTWLEFKDVLFTFPKTADLGSSFNHPLYVEAVYNSLIDGMSLYDIKKAVESLELIDASLHHISKILLKEDEAKIIPWSEVPIITLSFLLNRVMKHIENSLESKEDGEKPEIYQIIGLPHYITIEGKIKKTWGIFSNTNAEDVLKEITQNYKIRDVVYKSCTSYMPKARSEELLLTLKQLRRMLDDFWRYFYDAVILSTSSQKTYEIIEKIKRESYIRINAFIYEDETGNIKEEIYA